MQKHILDPKRLRRVPARFSWVDHRLIRRRLLSGADSAAWALYLFLVTVGDEQGLSYYSDASVCSHLSLCGEDLRRARSQLLERGLIAWQRPLYQVLCLSGSQKAGNPSTAASAQQGHINSLHLAEALGAIMKGGNS